MANVVVGVAVMVDAITADERRSRRGGGREAAKCRMLVTDPPFSCVYDPIEKM